MHKTPEITRLIHENFSLVTSFAFSRGIISDVIDSNFEGEWKFLNKGLFVNAEIRADRALLEMGTQLRVLDDKEGLNEIYKGRGEPALGTVIQVDGTVTDLHFRDLTNKIVHAAGFKWDTSDAKNPKIICMPIDCARWVRAEINIVALMGMIGSLMF